MAGHSCGRILLVILAFLVYIGAMAINAISSLYEYYNPGLFLSSTGNISDKYSLEITPAGWTFSIWGAIYVFQAVWLIYALTTLCRRNDDGYLYNNPAYLPATLYIMYILNWGCNITWLFVWDREYMEIALGFLAATALTLYIAIGATMHSLGKHSSELVENGNRQEIINTIAMVLNGLGIYAAWVTIATLLNLSIVLTYVLEVDQSISSSIALGILTLDAVVYACLDLVLFERHFRYIYTPYIVLHIALAGSLYKNWDTSNSNTVFTVALLCCGATLFLVKIIMSIVRSRTDPIHKNASGSKLA